MGFGLIGTRTGRKGPRDTWKDGKKDGLQTEWYKNGQKRLQRIFMGGLTESAMVWKTDGEKCSMIDVKAGNGIMSKYWDDGAEWLRITYKDIHMSHIGHILNSPHALDPRA